MTRCEFIKEIRWYPELYGWTEDKEETKPPKIIDKNILINSPGRANEL